MNLQARFESHCAALGIEEALLLHPAQKTVRDNSGSNHQEAGSRKNGRVVAAWGLGPTQQAAAARAAWKLPLGEVCRTQLPGFHSQRFLGLKLSVPVPWGGPAPLLLVGLRRGLASARRRAETLGGVLANHYENTALRERVYRLAHAAMLGELVFHTAHELNNPLTNVIGCADLLSDRVGKTSRTLETVLRLKAEADRALGIARRVLSLAAQDPGTQTVDWNSVVRRALELRAQALKLAAVQVREELGGRALWVQAQPVPLLHAVLNILLNAEQALEQCAYPRQLLLRTRRRGAGRGGRAQPQAVLEIANNGPAVPPEIAAQMFEPFFTTKPPGQGTGLGLSMARRALNQAGGTLTAENLAPGSLFREGGVQFRLTLPAVSEAHRLGAPAATIPAMRRKAGAPLKDCRILVVEDDHSLAQLLKEMLREQGCRVRVCSTAESALAEAAVNHYDLAITDFKLPGRSGSWLLEQLRQSRAKLARRVLFITGDTISPKARRELRASGQPVLPKPFHLDELTAAVQRLLPGGRQERT